MENPELARDVLAQIDARPDLFDMRTFGREESCGTVACIAGHVLLKSGYLLQGAYYRPGVSPDDKDDQDWLNWVQEDDEAAQLLGLDDEERYLDGKDIFYDWANGLDRFRELCRRQ